MKQDPPKKRLFRTWELVLWLLLLAVLLYFVLGYLGVDVVKVTEDSRILENPHQ